MKSMVLPIAMKWNQKRHRRQTQVNMNQASEIEKIST